MTLPLKGLGFLFTSLFITAGLQAQTNFNHLKLKDPATAGFKIGTFENVLWGRIGLGIMALGLVIRIALMLGSLQND
jgi:hypothetical protein